MSGDDHRRSSREPYRPAGLRPGTDQGVAAVLGIAIFGGILYAWTQIGWWALPLLLGIRYLPRLLLYSVVAVMGFAGSKEVREEQLRIARLEQDRNVPGLINMLDSEVKGLTKLSISRDSAVWALGRLGDPRAIPYLEERVHDPEETVRWSAVHALGRMKATGAENTLRGALHDDAALVRMSAAEALGRIAARDAISDLREVAHGDHDSQVRLYAVESLVLLGDKGSRDHVVDALDAVPRRLRNDSRWRRLREVIETGDPLTPWVSGWEQHRG
jgi:HEAT repeat protein